MRAAAGSACLNNSGSGPLWTTTARSLVQVAQVGLEWLLFACQLSLLLLKNAGLGRDLSVAVGMIPPPQRCDIQNTFLKVVDFSLKQRACMAVAITSSSLVPPSQRPLPAEPSPAFASGPNTPCEQHSDTDPQGPPMTDLKVLWLGGLRVGAALGLQPWLGFQTWLGC